VVAVALASTLTGCAGLTLEGHRNPLPNLSQVDEGLYRGGQPTAEGFRRLKAMGVKTVVSLRAQGDTRHAPEQELTESLGMKWVNLPMRMYWRPSRTQVDSFLRIAMDPANQPVFVHCEKGEDRTGSIVAMYRVVKQGWEPSDAYQEALRRGLAPWNPFMRNMVLLESTRKYAHLKHLAFAQLADR
jgi:protein tyrosine/serine phosphatase